jgi:hypothetical protein
VELFHEGLAEATSEAQAVRRDRKETVQLWAGELGRERLVLGGGSGQDWSEGRDEERTGDVRQTRTLDETETLHRTETIARCHTQIATQFPPAISSSRGDTLHDDTCAAARSAAGEVGARAAVSRARGELILLYMNQSTDRTRRCANKRARVAREGENKR